MDKDLIKLIFSSESISRPPEDICNKIKNLSGLLENNNFSNTSWKTLDNQSPTKKTNNFHSESFNSLSQLRKNTQSSSNSIESNTKGFKYVSKFKNNEKQIDDKINTIILSKLNKFSLLTYNDIREFLYQILGSSTDEAEAEKFTREFMYIVFKKAVSEDIFCPLYAKLLGEISIKYPSILDEMNKLHENYLNIFKETDNATFIEMNQEKKYRQGYSQFLAELTSLQILSKEKLVKTFEIITQQLILSTNTFELNKQYIDCILRISSVLEKRNEKFFVDIRSSLYIIVEPIYSLIKDSVLLNTQCKFLLLDIIDNLKN